MESPQLFGGQEECHSSESGWTMYIGSPCKDEDDEMDEVSENGEYDGDDDHKRDAYRDDESDDSMASDASSGPSHRKKSCGNEGVRGIYTFKNRENENDVSNKAKNAMEKKKFVKRKEGKKKESVLAATEAKFAVQNRKVRKNNWFG